MNFTRWLDNYLEQSGSSNIDYFLFEAGGDKEDTLCDWQCQNRWGNSWSKDGEEEVWFGEEPQETRNAAKRPVAETDMLLANKITFFFFGSMSS